MGQRVLVRALTAAGGVPWVIPLLPGDADTLHLVYDHLDGVFLTGGVDVDPGHYGEELHPACQRGRCALRLDGTNLDPLGPGRRKPLFGICRGIQALNVACGGSLYQDVADQYAPAIKHDYFSDDESTLPGPRGGGAARIAAGRVLGAERVQVNSMHHQAVKAFAPNLTAVAFAPDGLVEGVERPGDAFVIGVKWHPEDCRGPRPDAPTVHRLRRGGGVSKRGQAAVG